MNFGGNLLLAGGPGIHLGGSEQIVLFFEDAVRLGMDQVRVLAPYVDAGVFEDHALRSAWERLLLRSQTVVSVRTAAAAEVVLGACGTRRIDLRLDPNLHAKVFVAWRRGAEIALLGSHNLTAAALHANKEAGILIKPGADEKLRSLVQGLRRAADDLIRGAPAFDGRSFRPPRAGGMRIRRAADAAFEGRRPDSQVSALMKLSTTPTAGTRDALVTPRGQSNER